MTTTTRLAGTRGTVSAVAARAVTCAALAIAVTFASSVQRHSEPFGTLVLGGFLTVQAVVLAVSTTALALSRPGRSIVLARAAVSAVGGVVAIIAASNGSTILRPLEALVFLALGLLEVVGGLRRSERPDLAGDAVVVGGLQILVGLMLVILNDDLLFAIGVLAAWGAIVAVYLGISAVNLHRKRSA